MRCMATLGGTANGPASALFALLNLEGAASEFQLEQTRRAEIWPLVVASIT